METQTMNAKQNAPKDVYAIISDKIIEQLSKGIVPWHSSWNGAGMPANLYSKKPFRGINCMMLSALGYERNLYITAKQLKEIGASILPEEKPHMVVFWNYVERELGGTSATGDKRKQPFLRYYTVYNIAQCAGIPDAVIPAADWQPVPMPFCDQVVAELLQCPAIKHKEPVPYYDVLEDVINMPKKNTFEHDGSYHATLFHQLVHSTGHHTRLDRMGLVQMTEYGYDGGSLEELVAELGTWYLSALTGISDEAVLDKKLPAIWLPELKRDSHLIFTAFSLAQKAVDFILNVQYEDKNLSEE